MLKSKSLHPSDYEEIKTGIRMLTRTLPKGDFYFPHEHRWWEYASALQAFRDEVYDIGNPVWGRVLDAGGGRGILPSALKENFCTEVISLEIDQKSIDFQLGMGIKVREEDILDLSKKDGTYQAVFCISVLEHIPEWFVAIRFLADVVEPGGLLVVTMDYGDTAQRPWTNDTERVNKFVRQDVQEMVSILRQKGFKVNPDYTYYGNHVFDHTFFRLIGVRNEDVP